jgi:integrase
MLATGARIGEALAVVWAEVDLDAGTVQITSTLVRIKGEGLLRKETKSRAGERTLPLPTSAVAVLRRRFITGARLDQPVFPRPSGGFRDPSNVRRDLREARGEETLAWIISHAFRKTAFVRPIGCSNTIPPSDPFAPMDPAAVRALRRPQCAAVRRGRAPDTSRA